MKIFFMKLIVIVLPLSLIIGAVASAQDNIPDSLPPVRVDVSIAPSDGDIYVANMRRNGAEDEYGAYIMTVNNDGQPIFFQRLRGNRGFNFGRTADGRMYYGQVLDNGVGRGASMDSVFRVLDDEGEVVQEYQIVDGRTNPHEFILLDNGNVILISQPVEILDLTDYGGDSEAVTVAGVIQEIAPDGTVVFEWDSRDYFTVEDTARESFLRAEAPDPVPYIHINGVAVANDGNLIISARRFDELIKIDRETGEVIWHMGGGDSKHNEFTFINDPMNGFSGQHHIQVLANGNFLLFDNGNANPIQRSRAVEYAIDEENRTATRVWSYTDGRFTPTLGSVQRLPNGNTLIGWGSAPGYNVTEVTPDGRLVFAMALPPTQMSYRAYRFEAPE